MSKVSTCVLPARTTLSITVLAAFIFALALLLLNTAPSFACSSTGSPAVSTDKADYGALETAIISGSGFGCGETLSVRVTAPDGAVLSGDGAGTPGPDTVVTDGNGEFVLNYELSGTFPDGTPYVGQEEEYSVEVVAADGSVLANTTFTDSHFRFGHITWRRLSGNQVEFTITHAWRSTSCASGSLSFGDGGSQSFNGPIIATLTDSAGNDYCVKQDHIAHTYLSEGPHSASWSGCCRISNLVNAADRPWYVATTVDLRNGNTGSPVSSIPPILQMPQTAAGQVWTIPLSTSDPDSDSVTCRMATSAESSINSLAQAGSNVIAVTSGCELQWDTNAAPLNAKYAVQVILEEHRPDSSVNKVPLDFIVEIAGDAANQPPACTLNGAASNVVAVGQPFSISATGTDPENQSLVLQALNLPAGSTLTPPVGSVVASGDSATFNWTPTSANAGQAYAVNMIFTDPGNLQSVCSFSVQVPSNQSPTADAGPDASGNEGSPIALDGEASDPDGDSVTTTWSVDNPALCSFDDANAPDTTITCTDNGSFVVTLTADDGNGGVSADTATVTVNNVDPDSVTLSFTPDDTVELGTSIHLEATFGDAGSNDTHEALIDWGDGTTCDTAVDAACSVDQGANTVLADHTYAEPDVYLVHVRITDDDGGFKNKAYPYVVVWDPNAGFVTGNGAIQNDANKDFSKDAALKGKKGDFGFVSKPQSDGTLFGKAQYRITDPTGVLLDFVSLSQEWLVIDGEQAIFQGGQGTIGGQMDADGGYYQFFISVIDGKYTADPQQTDYFRIQIKDSQGVLIYDTQYTALMSADADRPLTAGKIFIRHNYTAAADADGLIIVGNPPAELLDALRDGPSAPVEGLDMQFFLPSLNG